MLLVASSCHGNRRKSRGNCSIVDRECSAADPSPAPLSRCSTSGVQDDTSVGESLEAWLQHGQGSISGNGATHLPTILPDAVSAWKFKTDGVTIGCSTTH